MKHWSRNLPEVGDAITGGHHLYQSIAAQNTAGHIERLYARKADLERDVAEVATNIAAAEAAVLEKVRAVYTETEVRTAMGTP